MLPNGVLTRPLITTMITHLITSVGPTLLHQLVSHPVLLVLAPLMTIASPVPQESISYLQDLVGTIAIQISTRMDPIFVIVRSVEVLECDGACDGCTGAGNTLCEAC